MTAGPRVFRAASFFEMRSGKIARLTEYWVEEGVEKPPAWGAPFCRPVIVIMTRSANHLPP